MFPLKAKAGRGDFFFFGTLGSFILSFYWQCNPATPVCFAHLICVLESASFSVMPPFSFPGSNRELGTNLDVLFFDKLWGSGWSFKPFEVSCFPLCPFLHSLFFSFPWPEPGKFSSSTPDTLQYLALLLSTQVYFMSSTGLADFAEIACMFSDFGSEGTRLILSSYSQMRDLLAELQGWIQDFPKEDVGAVSQTSGMAVPSPPPWVWVPQEPLETSFKALKQVEIPAPLSLCAQRHNPLLLLSVPLPHLPQLLSPLPWELGKL